MTLPDAPAALARRPVALLLDFGGVIFLTSKHPDGRRRAAELLVDRLARAGWVESVDRIERSLTAGFAALKDWKNAASRQRKPHELEARAIWNDFLVSDLDDGPRAVLAGDGPELLQSMTALLSGHHLREGVLELLQTARELGVRVGIVSNAHSGRSHRALLADHGIDHLIDVQLYSDEVGIRKPHPGIIALAATALATEPSLTWYVGDTYDRDLVAGRRAGVGAVVLTRSQHTDHTPYPVSEAPDAVLDDPRGLIELLRAAVPHDGHQSTPEAALSPVSAAAASIAGRRRPAAEHASEPRLPRALLLDHGGVISASTKDPEAQRHFAQRICRELRTAGHSIDEETFGRAMDTARFRHKEWKSMTDGGDDGMVPEITARMLWEQLTGHDLSEGVRAWLAAESARLSHEFALIKSRATVRPGVIELFDFARAHGLRIAIVSNTVSGRAVRQRLAGYGLLDDIAVSVYSDELGRRKPDRAMPGEALQALGLDPEECWFVGDKPDRDMAAAHQAGIATTVLVRGGSSSDAAVDGARQSRHPHLRPDLVVDDLLELTAHLSAVARIGTHRTAPLPMERNSS